MSLFKNGVGRPSNETIKKRNVFKGICVLLVLVILGLIGYILNDKGIINLNSKKMSNNDVDIVTKTKKEDNVKISYNSFFTDEYEISLLSKAEDLKNIYAFDIDYSNLNNNKYKILAKYKDEKIVEIAKINIKDKNVKLEYRTLDVDKNRLYFIINENDGLFFKLYYIDLENLNNGPKELDDFNTIYKNENEFCPGLSKTCTTYSTKIQVSDGNIYYTSFKEGNIKKYNISTRTSERVQEVSTWYEWFMDKKSKKIFYVNKSKKLLLYNINDKSNIEIDNSKNTSSDFWTNFFYNDMPGFIESVNMTDDERSIENLYVFNYKNNAFEKIKENIKTPYVIKYNNIDLLENIDSSYNKNTFFVVNN